MGDGFIQPYAWRPTSWRRYDRTKDWDGRGAGHGKWGEGPAGHHKSPAQGPTGCGYPAKAEGDNSVSELAAYLHLAVPSQAKFCIPNDSPTLVCRRSVMQP